MPGIGVYLLNITKKSGINLPDRTYGRLITLFSSTCFKSSSRHRLFLKTVGFILCS